MSAALEAALHLAALGIPVFPCARSKRPALQGRGFHDATTDSEQVRAMFGRAGELVGCPTGAVTGFDVLDLDYRHGATEWEQANLYRLPETRIHRTQSGGRHYLFRHAPGVRNTASKIAAGIDVRGDGGYVIMPPSSDYAIIDDAEIAEWPDWLLDQILAQPIPPPKSNGFHYPKPISSRRLDGFVRSVCARVASAGEGAKHFALRNAALSLGGIQQAAGLSDSEAEDLLLRELPQTVKDWKNARQTIAWGLAHGRNRPIELADREGSRHTAPSEAPRQQAEPLDEQELEQEQVAALSNELDVHRWADLKVPKEERLLGELVTPATRTFLVGTTGVGKTLLGQELVAAMAAGTGFLHWHCDRPSRWLILDGEMPTGLIQRRLSALVRRHSIRPGNMLLYSASRAEEIAKLIPGIPEMPPLNTPAGHRWVMHLAQVLQIEGILFDNLMSLSPGNHAEPETWLDTQPLVTTLSHVGIAQIWCDHTGWDASRQYGTSIKSWRFDTVGLIKPLPEEQRQPNETAFTLTFEPPGKARRRTPENWRDFQPHTVRFAGGEWSSEPADAPAAGELTPEGRGWFRDIANAFATPGLASNQLVNASVRFALKRNDLREHLRQCGRIGDGSHVNLTDADRSRLRSWLNKLKDHGKIGMSGDWIWLA